MNESEEPASFDKAEFQLEESKIDEIYNLVSQQFPILDYYMEHGTLTFHVQTDENSKEAFLKLYKSLKPTGFLPILRREGGKEIIRIVNKPPVKKSNIMINLALFLATLATTFLTGYFISGSREGLDPIFGGLTFMITIMAILGVHESAHKLAANKHGIEATLPYFIPAPPQLGIGTFGAVIMQKSLPPNRDALFDVGASGPIAGFIVSVIAMILGLPFSTYNWVSPKNTLIMPPPIFLLLFGSYFSPQIPPNFYEQQPGPDFVPAISLHPVALAGYIGMIVTMLNLLPVGTLDGGHIIESLFGGKAKMIFLIISIVLVLMTPFWLMIIFVLLFGMYRHPGPLDSISCLSRKRKALAIAVLLVFILSMPMPSFLY
ncbi:site-2 protease family protein [Candidatus Bathyarchaeota archaeon]|nr:site-2 protease family protein [Candidatus Bathyarchaeota archaeon]